MNLPTSLGANATFNAISSTVHPRNFLGALDAHSGALQVLAAVILAIVTAYYAWVTHNILVQARQAQRPYVVVDLLPSVGAHLEIVVCNTGDRMAHAVKFSVTRDFSDGRGQALSQYPPFSKGLQSLAPGNNYHFFVRTDGRVWERPEEELRFDLTVNYRSGPDEYSEQIELDLSAHKDRLLRSLANPHPNEAIVEQLRDIKNELGRRSPNELFGLPLRPPCRFCGEPHAQGALKCPHCHEWLEPKTEIRGEGYEEHDGGTPDG